MFKWTLEWIVFGLGCIAAFLSWLVHFLTGRKYTPKE